MDSNDITRRRVISSLGAAGAVGLAGCGGGNGDGNGNGTDEPGDGTEEPGTGNGDGETTPQDVSGTISIGALVDVTGALPYYGQQGISGFDSGLAYKATQAGSDDVMPQGAHEAGNYSVDVGDLTVEFHVRDTQGAADQAESLAVELVQDDEVDWLYGVWNSSGALRVIENVVKQTQRDVPYIAGPAASTAITNDGDNCHDLVFRANENTGMDALSGGRYVADETDASSIALFGSNDTFGRSVVNNYEKVFVNGGVDIQTKQFVQSGYSNWDGLLSEVEEQGADGIVGGFTFQTLVPLLNSFLGGDYDLNVYGGMASNFTLGAMSDPVTNALGEGFTAQDITDAQLGPFTSRYHWNQYDNDINDWYIDAHVEAYDIVPDLFTSGAFVAATSIVESHRLAGSTDAGDAASQMRGLTVTDTPKGENEYTYQTYNNQAASKMTVAPLIPNDEENWPSAVQPGDPLVTIDADETTVGEDDPDMTCSL